MTGLTKEALALAVAVLAGCASPRHQAPVEERSAASRPGTTRPPVVAPAPTTETVRAEPGTYFVKPGDTLMGISLDAGESWRVIARWTNVENPNLIEGQKSSYDLFLRSGDSDKPLDGEGTQGTFQSVFPIKDFNETSVLEFVKYELEKPKYDVDECQSRDMTYAAPLKVTLRLIVFAMRTPPAGST